MLAEPAHLEPESVASVVRTVLSESETPGSSLAEPLARHFEALLQYPGAIGSVEVSTRLVESARALRLGHVEHALLQGLNIKAAAAWAESWPQRLLFT